MKEGTGPKGAQTIGERLRAQRAQLGLSQDQMAKAAGIPIDTYKKYEGDSRVPGGEALAGLGAAGVDLPYVLIGPHHGSRSVRELGSEYNVARGPDIKGKVPLISWVQAGTWSSVVDNLQPGDAEEWVETTVPIRKHTYALRVSGASMTNPAGDPSFPHGSIIVVEPDAVTDLDAMLNAFVIVKRTADDEATFKQLVRDAGRYLLKPLNPQYPALELREDDVFCGVVREKVMRFF